MLSKTSKQKHFMEKACKDPEFAKEHNIDQKVACEFHEADKVVEEKKEKKQENKK